MADESKHWVDSFLLFFPMLLIQSDVTDMNTPKSEERLLNSGDGTIRGARECSINSTFPIMQHDCAFHYCVFMCCRIYRKEVFLAG